MGGGIAREGRRVREESDCVVWAVVVFTWGHGSRGR